MHLCRRCHQDALVPIESGSSSSGLRRNNTEVRHGGDLIEQDENEPEDPYFDPLFDGFSDGDIEFGFE